MTAFIKYRNLTAVVAIFSVLFGACMVVVPVGQTGSGGGQRHELIIQMQPDQIKSFEKDYKSIGLRKVQDLSPRNRIFLFEMYSNESTEQLAEVLNSDIRTEVVRPNTPVEMR